MLRAAESGGAWPSDLGWWTRAVLLVFLALVGAAGATAAPRLAPAKGRLLIAGRALGDANFSHSVILLLEYSEEGALGVIVNRPAGIPPAALLPDVSGLARYEGSVFLGGPVGVERMLLLVRGCDRLAATQSVYGDVCYSGSAEVLDELARTGDAKPERVRMYAGYSGWGGGQLEREIARGDWHVAEARDERVFSEDPFALWERLAPAPEPIETRIRRPPADVVVALTTSTDR
jgi:putative transcriptional regulator